MRPVRLIACGSVDDGKSTLLGRLLHDTGAVPADQLAALGPAPDLSRLLDGLAAEREQGVTIDVAHRPFDLDGRRFILADAPGHEQYTRNMATAASTADVAVVLVDARKTLQPQTRRHLRLLALMGVRRVLLAVNKMDLVDHASSPFHRIEGEFRAFASSLAMIDLTAIPLSALTGAGVTRRDPVLSWHDGPLLSEWLAATPLPAVTDSPFRLPVQTVIRHGEHRSFAGRIAAGAVRPGDPVRVLPSGAEAAVATVTGAGPSVSLTLDRLVEVSRGDWLVSPDAPPAVADQFEAHLVWMSDQPLLPGRTHDLKIGTATVPARVMEIRHRVDPDTGEALAARTLALNDIGVVTLSLDVPVPFEPYNDNRDLGGFVLIDRMTSATAGAGMIRFALRRATNIRPQPLSVSRQDRAVLKGQHPLVLWFTGLSGVGKSTIADRVEQRLFAAGLHSTLLDGDNVRGGLNRDLGFTDADRVENIRRVAEVARLMTDAGLIVLVAFISPFRAEREMARGLMAPGEFLEIHIDAPLAVVESRDVKGLYARARAGRLANFTGIDSPYEPPTAPDLRIDTTACSCEQAADLIMDLIRSRQGR